MGKFDGEILVENTYKYICLPLIATGNLPPIGVMMYIECDLIRQHLRHIRMSQKTPVGWTGEFVVIQRIFKLITESLVISCYFVEKIDSPGF